ncbi:MAG: hypothetical protein HQK51_13465 [Oligoflexia bacterium]|nr:hypothetical protein [Oligoflexia bacterium]
MLKIYLIILFVIFVNSSFADVTQVDCRNGNITIKECLSKIITNFNTLLDEKNILQQKVGALEGIKEVMQANSNGGQGNYIGIFKNTGSLPLSKWNFIGEKTE